MENSSMKASANKEYITSDRWKCGKSPSGAHHWVIYGYQMTCKYCNGSKSANAIDFGLHKPEAK